VIADTPDTAKDQRLGFHLTKQQKQTISIQSTLQGAEELLADRCVSCVPADKWDQFLELLQAPVETNQGLQALFTRPSVFVD
jgi:uncharacterized protein (DUF1778 family)